MKKRRDTPWHKWWFTLAGLWLILLFGYVAWKALSRSDEPLAFRIVGAAFFGGIAVVFALLEWRNRRSMQINAREDKTNGGT